jgi:hypothetical protein
MFIDCNECAMQHTPACADCVVGVLLRDSDGPLALDAAETAALGNLAAVGLVPRLKLVPVDGADRTEPPFGVGRNTSHGAEPPERPSRPGSVDREQGSSAAAC